MDADERFLYVRFAFANKLAVEEEEEEESHSEAITRHRKSESFYGF